MSEPACPHRRRRECDLVTLTGWTISVNDQTCAACRAEWTSDEPPARPTNVVKNLRKSAQRRGRRADSEHFVEFRRPGVGDHFARLAAEKMDCPRCPACDATQVAMNKWGPAGCRERLAEIVTGIVPRAIRCAVKDASWRQVFVAIKDAWTAGGITAAVEALVLQAIDEAEAAGQPLPFDPRITVLVTAFNRPKHLEQLIASLRHWHGDARLVIADNGSEPVAAAGAKYLTLPFDSGLSAARNAGFAECETEYVLLCEDDFVFDERANVAHLVDVLDSFPGIGVACGISETSYRQSIYTYSFRIDNGVDKWDYEGPRLTAKNGTSFWIADGGCNYALFRREVVCDVRWDERLKVGEHDQFYRDVQKQGRWNVAVVPSAIIGHDKRPLGRDPDYATHRSRANELREKFVPLAGPPSKVNAESPRCILVAGTGRCGTSMVAAWLQEAGVYVGRDFVPPDDANPLGYWEDAEAHELLLRRDVAGFDRLIRFRNATQPLWGVKNPRIMAQWAQLRELAWPADVRVIHCDRMAAAVIDSYRRAYPRMTDAEAWYEARLAAVNEFLRDAESRGWPVHLVDFDLAIERPDDTRAAVSIHVDAE